MLLALYLLPFHDFYINCSSTNVISFKSLFKILFSTLNRSTLNTDSIQNIYKNCDDFVKLHNQDLNLCSMDYKTLLNSLQTRPVY